MRLSINYGTAVRNHAAVRPTRRTGPHGLRLGPKVPSGAWATSATLGRANMRHTLSRVLRNAITTGGLP